MLSPRILTLLLLCLLQAGCCFHRIDRNDFAALPAEQKASRLERAYRENCIRSDRMSIVDLISDEGLAGAEAMRKYLIESPSENLQWDATIVVRSVYSAGSDLRGRGFEALLFKLCQESPNSYVRESAARTLDRLRRYEPGPNPKSEDNPAGWARAMAEDRGPAPPCGEPPS